MRSAPVNAADGILAKAGIPNQPDEVLRQSRGELLAVEIWENSIEYLNFSKDPGCPVCSRR